MYDSSEEAQQKIVSSVVLFEGAPVFVLHASGKKGKVVLGFKYLPMKPHENPDENVITRNIDDPGWDFKSMASKLGYTYLLSPVNNFFESVFLNRIPVRTSRQGLDNKTVQILYPDPNSHSYSWNDVIYRSSGLNDTIKNIFPNPKDAFDKLSASNSLYRSVPIHRKLALHYDKVSPPYFFYKLDKVGYTEDGINFKLAKHKQYLKEELVDMIGLKVS